MKIHGLTRPTQAQYLDVPLDTRSLSSHRRLNDDEAFSHNLFITSTGSVKPSQLTVLGLVMGNVTTLCNTATLNYVPENPRFGEAVSQCRGYAYGYSYLQLVSTRANQSWGLGNRTPRSIVSCASFFMHIYMYLSRSRNLSVRGIDGDLREPLPRLRSAT